MATIYQHRIFVIVDSASMPGVLSAFDAIYPREDGEPRTGSNNEFGLGLNATGTGSPTHYGAVFSVTESVRQAMDAANLDQAAGVSFWRATNPESVLVTTNNAASQDNIGDPWQWQDCLDAVNLRATA